MLNALSEIVRDRMEAKIAVPGGSPTRAGSPRSRSRSLCFFLRRHPGAVRRHRDDSRTGRHRAHRAVGLRQKHVPAHAQPHERHHRRHPRLGQVLLEGTDIYHPAIDVVALRKRVGMVFQKSTPFPKSIFENVAYGPRVAGQKNSKTLSDPGRGLACSGPRCGTRSRTG